MRTNILFFLTIASMMKTFLSFEEDLRFLSLPNVNDYDMYVFSVQWGGTLCHSASNGCSTKLKSIPKNIFTLHGLWPNQSSGKKMDKCNLGHEIKIIKDTSDIFTEMETFWISFTHDDDSFWSHEFNTHGYCFTQKFHMADPKMYFQFALDLYKKYDMSKLLRRAYGDLTGSHSFDYVDLFDHVASVTGDLRYELVCRHYEQKQYLQEIRFFFDLKLQPMDIGRKGDCNMNAPILVDFE